MIINSNKEFDNLLLEEYQKHSKYHWVPFEIAHKCGNIFKANNCKFIADIGSGVGKFTLLARQVHKAKYIGIELRKNLFTESRRLNERLQLDCYFINSNSIEISLSHFDGIFYYNPFCEQEAIDGCIDLKIDLSPGLFNAYNDDVIEKLDAMKSNSILITYKSPYFEPPHSFKAIDILPENEMVVWKKS